MGLKGFFKAIERHTPPILAGFGVYSALKFTLEAVGVIGPSVTPFDTFSVLSLGFLYLFEKHVRMTHLLALAPAVIALAFFHDFFGVFLGTEGFTGDVVMGLFILIGFCIYFIHFFMRHIPEHPGESPREEGGKASLYLDAENKFFIPAELLKYHTEVIGSSGMGKTNIFNYLIEQGIRNGLGMFVFDAKSNYNKTIPYYASKHGRLRDFKYFDLADVKRSQTYNPDFKDKPDEVFNGLMKSIFFGPVTNEFFRDQASDVLSNLTNLLFMEFKHVTRMDYQNLISNEIRTFDTIKVLARKHENTVSGKYFLEKWVKMPDKDREMNLSGLTSKLARFTTRDWSPLINTLNPDIKMRDVVEKGQIFLFGTSSLVNQEDSKPVIISALIDLAGVIGRRLIEKPDKPFFVFLDEFYTAAYPGLNDLISLGREANVCFFLAHHSLGQLGAVSQEFKDDILTNTNHKIVLNITEKETVDFFAGIFGTKVTKKDVYSYDTRISQPRGRTEKQDEEFIIHPNYLRGMKRGEAVCRIVYVSGPKVFKMKLKEVKPPPASFDYVQCVPIRNNHLKPIESNKIVVPKIVTAAKGEESAPSPSPGKEGKGREESKKVQAPAISMKAAASLQKQAMDRPSGDSGK
jgi:type IV secretory pathway TraG/TraD family ATPase VirD4